MTETKYNEDRINQIKALHRENPTELADVLLLMQKETDLFLDLIPGYKIREQKISMGQSKAVIHVQRIEQTILVLYKKFLDFLLKSTRARVGAVADKANVCLCKLLSVASYFNYSSNLIQAVVEGCNSKNQDVASRCVESVTELFDSDGVGEATLKAITCITNHIKLKGHTINPQLVGCFINLRIAVVDAHKLSNKEKEKSRNKKTSKMKEDITIEHELQQAEAVPTRESRRKTQTAILQRLVAAYLRVLEAAQNANGVRQARLLGPTMEGLNKFALLLDVDLLNLLITAIKDILNSPKTTPLTTLNAVMTLAILTNAAETATARAEKGSSGEVLASSSVSVDLTEAYAHLYRVIPGVLSVPTAAELMSISRERRGVIKEAAAEKIPSNLETASMVTSAATTAGVQHEYINSIAERNRRVKLLLRALNLLLLKPQQVPLPRTAAFLKRLATYSVHQPPHIAMAIMTFIRSVTQKRPTLSDLIAQNADVIASSGRYNPDAESPDQAMAHSAVFWEWCLLNDSYHPTLRTLTAVVQKTALQAQDPTFKRPAGVSESMLASVNKHLTRAPEDVLRLHDTSLGTFNPPPSEPKKAKRQRPNPLGDDSAVGKAE